MGAIDALDPDRIRVVLCDVDGNLIPSEPVALEASAPVTNRIAESLGLRERFTPEGLAEATTGRNFRALAGEFAEGSGPWSPPRRALRPDELERWVEEERRVVSEHLRRHLEPDPQVQAALERISSRFELAAVSASAIARLQASFEAAGLTAHFPIDRCFSAEDSLEVPVSKPNPAVYLEALRRLEVQAADTVAIEDSMSGVRAAVAAGCPTVGNLTFVAAGARQERRAAMAAAGVVAVVESWAEFADLLGAPVVQPS
jgi:HAD superfamily hydrolase (TIGR01509 family)